MTVTPEKVLATIRKKLDWSNNSARIDPTDLKSLAASANNSVWCRKGNNFSPTAFADVPNSRIREKKKKKKKTEVYLTYDESCFTVCGECVRRNDIDDIFIYG